MFVYETGQLTNPRLIVNFPTKRHWRGKSRMEDIEAGLKALAETVRQYHIQSIAIPPLGSGLGRLHRTEVKPPIEAAMAEMRRTKRLSWRPARLKTPRHSCNNTRIPAGVSTRFRRLSRDSCRPSAWNCWLRRTGYCNTNPCVQRQDRPPHLCVERAQAAVYAPADRADR